MEGNSVVYVLGESTSDCGYCGARRSSDGKGARRKSGSARSETSVSYGMHAEVLSVQTYQELLDRGWRRSGKWLYKPVLAKTCCQLQTIRLEVDKYESSASQRRVRKRWERYLSAGDQGQGVVGEHLGGGSECEDGVGEEKCTGCVYDEHRMEKSVAGSDGTSSDGTDRLSVDMVDLVEEDFEGEEEEEEMEPKRPRSPQGEAGLEIDGKGGMELLPDGKSSVPTTPNGTLVDCKGKGYKWKRQRSQLCLGSLLDGDLTELSPSLGLKEKLRVESVSAEPIDIHDVRAAVTNALANALAIAKRESEIPDLAYPSVTLKWAKEGLKKAHGSDLVLSSSIAFAIAGNIKGWNKRNGGQAVEMTPERVATQLLKRITLEDRWGVSLRQVDGHLNVFCALSNVEKSMVRSRCVNGEPLGTKKANKPPVAPKTEHVAGKQTFRVVTVPSSHPDIPEVEFELFKKYQTIHHKDTDVSLKSFKRFLCDSPLVPVSRVESPSAPSCGYGSFHQQYWLGDRLVAVGVVDVLPKCLSSKYFFWDPSMAKLSLGTLASLLEIDWVKNEATHAPEFRYYYLGYYLHDCHRMKYKASFSPSELLCPLTYQWVPIVSIADDLDRGLPPWNMKGHVGKSMGKTRAYRNPGEDGEAMEDLNETEEIDDVNLAITFPDSQRQAWKVMPFRVVRQLGLIRSGAEELSRAIRRWMDMVGPVCSNMLYAV